MKLNPFNKVKFVRAVNQFLDFYHKICSEAADDGEFPVKKPNISCFAVQFCLESGFASDIEKWIEFATQFLRVYSLVLELRCDAAVFKDMLRADPCVIKNKEKYVIGSNNNGDCKLFNPGFGLNKLRLTSCVLDESLFGNHLVFGSLTELSLTSIPLARYDADSMFGSLVNIETLFLRHCSLPRKFSLGSMPSLQKVRLIQCLKVLELSTLNNLKITEVTTDTEIVLDLGGAPNLESLVARLDASGAYSLFNVTWGKLPVLSALDVTIYADFNLCFPDRLPMQCNIKTLTLKLYHDTKFDVLKMIHLVEALPSLCKLDLSMWLKEDLGQEKVETNDIAIRHLKQVTIFTDHGTKNLFQFASYLLKHATSLQKLKLTKALLWDEEELQLISVLEEQSTDVELVFKQ